MTTWGLYLVPWLITHWHECVLVVSHTHGEIRANFRLIKVCDIQDLDQENRLCMVKDQMNMLPGVLRLPGTEGTFVVN